MVRTLEGSPAIWKEGQNKLQLSLLINWRGGNFFLNKKKGHNPKKTQNTISPS